MDVGYLKTLGLEIKTGPSHVLTKPQCTLAGAKLAPAAASASSKSSKPAAAAAPVNGKAAVAASAGNFGSDLLGKGFDRTAVVRNNHPPWLVPNSGHDAKLKVYNTLTGEKEAFRPLNGKKVIWYTCGPTVYDVAHMGHARAYLTFDILRRIMKDYLGFEVKYQINITDIDDKIILRARQNKLFDDFTKEASKMSATELEKFVKAAVEFKADKLKKKAPEQPKKDASPKDKAEYENLKLEHELKLGQHKDLSEKVTAALKAGNKEAVLAAAREPIMEKIDKEKGHTVSDHSIFDAHGRRFENEYFEDMDNLGILRPDVVTRITEYMDGRVQKFIERLEELGVAYGSAGSVYFDIGAFEKLGYKYRKLVPAMCASAKEMEEGEGALAADDAEKKNPNDFALWKKSKPGEPAWESKWGPGRPGWHIECSVMATDINGDYLDIHAGGEDLKFPHHDNEMAQSEAYLQRSQWVNYFWHAGHLHIEGLKMSKSLKNFITIRQALAVHSARQLRMMFLMQAWDKGMNYSDQAIDMARVEERKAKHFFGSLAFWRRFAGKADKGEKGAKLEASTKATEAAINACILNNFDTPGVINAISKLVSECKDYLGAMPKVSLEPVEEAKKLVERTLGVLGVTGLEIEKPEAQKWTPALDAFAQLRHEVREKKGDPKGIADSVAKALPAAEAAKKAGLKEVAKAMEDFASDLKALKEAKDVLKRCDKVRDDDFVKLGVRLEDRANEGFLWMFDDRAVMEAEQQEKEEKDREAVRAKLKNKYDQKVKDLTVAEKSAVPHTALFTSGANAGVYSDFDDEGIPKKANGEEISAKKRKDLVKEMAKQEKDYQKLQKQAGEGGIAKYLEKLKGEVAEMEKQMK
eukprot:TRINITY_DN14337_c3_g1_i2.p1 TRINITY_DN14337_c3_g1~~TRINITY_DN14337_c3_g1_i2.p1  ORF type:complete len:901 (-),score=247.11 TRINITY_DN14337_c3_g1_i2:250-2844(-)